MNRNWFARAKSALQSAYADIVWDVLHLAALLMPRVYLWLHARLSPEEFVETVEIDGQIFELRGIGHGRDRKYVMRELGSASALGMEAWVEFQPSASEGNPSEDSSSDALAA
jgi:hypothetical protein